MQSLTLECPRCKGDLSVRVYYHLGDLVPYGSTWARTPGTVEVEIDNCSKGCELTDKELQELDEKACNEADNDYLDYDPREDREDVP